MSSLDHLVALKGKADYAYHTSDDPIMSDADYDKLVRDIRAAGGEITDVGGPVDGRFAKVTHIEPMMSLDNAFTTEDVEEWFASLGYHGNITSQKKLDGLSLALIYENGVLVTAATRGTGLVGEDVTEQAKRVEGIPHRIETTDEFVEVRGEVVMQSSPIRARSSSPTLATPLPDRSARRTRRSPPTAASASWPSASLMIPSPISRARASVSPGWSSLVSNTSRRAAGRATPFTSTS
jgi:DNA ligase (NAD+)